MHAFIKFLFSVLALIRIRVLRAVACILLIIILIPWTYTPTITTHKNNCIACIINFLALVLAPVLLRSSRLNTLVLRGGNCRLRRADCDALAETCTSLQHLLLDPSPHDLHLAPVIRACRSLSALMLDDPPPDLYTLETEFLWFSSVLEPSALMPLLRSLCMNCHLTPRFGPSLALHASNLQVNLRHTLFSVLIASLCACEWLHCKCVFCMSGVSSVRSLYVINT